MISPNYWLFFFHSAFMHLSEAESVCYKGCSCLAETKYVNCSGGNISAPLSKFPFGTEYLDLSRNNLAELPPGSFWALWVLKVLLLKENKITSVADRAFINLHNLEKLDLSWNQLSSLGNGFSMGLNSLTELVLAHNCLTVLEVRSFENLDSLVKLDISANLIYFFKPRALSSMTALRLLYLNGNKLITLDVDVFSTLRSLEILSLRGNKISFTETGAFSLLCNLVQLDLAFNQLTGLHVRTLGNICTTNVHVLLEGNPWHCDCDLQRVFSKLASIHRLYLDDYERLRCSEPADLQGSLMVAVADELCMAETVTVLILTGTVVITVVAAIVMGEKNKRRGPAQDWEEENAGLEAYCDHLQQGNE